MDRQLVCKGYYHRQFWHITRASLKYYRFLDTSTYTGAFVSGEHKKNAHLFVKAGEKLTFFCSFSLTLWICLCLICLFALVAPPPPFPSANRSEPSVVWDGSLHGGGGLQPLVQQIRLDLHQGQWSYQDRHGNLLDVTLIYAICT